MEIIRITYMIKQINLIVNNTEQTIVEFASFILQMRQSVQTPNTIMSLFNKNNITVNLFKISNGFSNLL